MPGAEHAEAVDADGRAALSVLRALGMPGVAVAVQGGAAGSSSMKERSAAKKRAEKAVCAEVRVRGAAVAWLRWGRRLMVLGRGVRVRRSRRKVCLRRATCTRWGRGITAQLLQPPSCCYPPPPLTDDLSPYCTHTSAGRPHLNPCLAFSYCLLLTVTRCIACV